MRNGQWRPISGAFQGSSDGSGMSVHLAEIAHECSLQPNDLLPTSIPATNFGMIDLTVSAVYDEDQVVVRDALPEDPSHANVVGNKTGGRRKRWSKLATVLFLPAAKTAPTRPDGTPW